MADGLLKPCSQLWIMYSAHCNSVMWRLTIFLGGEGGSLLFLLADLLVCFWTHPKHFILYVLLQAEGSSSASSGSQAADVKGNQSSNPQIPCLLSMPTRNHMDITTPPLPPVAPEVLRVAEHRHKKGLMYPYIFHVLTKVWHLEMRYCEIMILWR